MLRVFLIVFVGSVAHLLNEIDSIIFHTVLNIDLLTDLLLLSLFVPQFPFLLVQSGFFILHEFFEMIIIISSYLKMRVLVRGNPLAYRSISQMDEQEAQ